MKGSKMTRLIDTHQHLIYPDAAGYSGTDGIAPLANRSFTLAQTQRLSDWLSVTAEIFGQRMQDELAVIGANTAKNIFLDR